ncbi:MAG: hypothetical protein GX885_08280 [Methanomicrobiales archaeon]|nr:hypothetical protein [Methanomicrobiales archaeon]
MIRIAAHRPGEAGGESGSGISLIGISRQAQVYAGGPQRGIGLPEHTVSPEGSPAAQNRRLPAKPP